MNNTLLSILLIFVVINCLTNLVLINAIYDFNEKVVVPAHKVGEGLIALKDVMKLFIPSISIVDRALGLLSSIQSLNMINTVGGWIGSFRNSTGI